MTSVDDVPLAHTPDGGWATTPPPPVLTGCDEPLPAEAPDLRGLWRAVEIEVGGEVLPDHPILGHTERVEQAGDRLVITTAGIVHDMRCDGTEDRGLRDVMHTDHSTPIHAVATYEGGVHVMRPIGYPGIEVTRQRDGDDVLWSYAGAFVARLRRIADESAPWPES